MYVSKFYAKRKPEKKLLSVRRETMMLVWSRVVAAGTSVQGGLAGGQASGQGASGGQGGGGQFSGQSSFRNAYEGAIDIRDIKDVSLSKDDSTPRLNILYSHVKHVICWSTVRPNQTTST